MHKQGSNLESPLRHKQVKESKHRRRKVELSKWTSHEQPGKSWRWTAYKITLGCFIVEKSSPGSHRSHSDQSCQAVAVAVPTAAVADRDQIQASADMEEPYQDRRNWAGSVARKVDLRGLGLEGTLARRVPRRTGFGSGRILPREWSCKSWPSLVQLQASSLQTDRSAVGPCPNCISGDGH